MGDYYTVKVKRKIIEDARKADPRRTDMLIETYCTSDMDFDELMFGLKMIAEEGKNDRHRIQAAEGR